MVSERSPRVVITGVGALTPLGNSFNEIGDALQAGRPVSIGMKLVPLAVTETRCCQRKKF